MKRDLVSEVMREMGKKGGKAGGKKGGKARMAALTPEQRSELARKAVRTRWAKRPRRNANGLLKEQEGLGIADDDPIVADRYKRCGPRVAEKRFEDRSNAAGGKRFQADRRFQEFQGLLLSPACASLLQRSRFETVSSLTFLFQVLKAVPQGGNTVFCRKIHESCHGRLA